MQMSLPVSSCLCSLPTVQDNNRVKHKQFEITIHFLLRRRNGDDTTEAKQIEEEVLLKCWYVCMYVAVTSIECILLENTFGMNRVHHQ